MEENKVMETPEVIEENIELMEPEVYEMEPEEESGIGLGKLALGTALVAGGIGVLCYKFRDKIEKRRVEKLRKKGYVVLEPEEDIIEAEVVDDFDDFEEEESEK